jgi:hypothetical protein
MSQIGLFSKAASRLLDSRDRHVCHVLPVHPQTAVPNLVSLLPTLKEPTLEIAQLIQEGLAQMPLLGQVMDKKVPGMTPDELEELHAAAARLLAALVQALVQAYTATSSFTSLFPQCSFKTLLRASMMGFAERTAALAAVPLNSFVDIFSYLDLLRFQAQDSASVILFQGYAQSLGRIQELGKQRTWSDLGQDTPPFLSASFNQLQELLSCSDPSKQLQTTAQCLLLSAISFENSRERRTKAITAQATPQATPQVAVAPVLTAFPPGTAPFSFTGPSRPYGPLPLPSSIEQGSTSLAFSTAGTSAKASGNLDSSSAPRKRKAGERRDQPVQGISANQWTSMGEPSKKSKVDGEAESLQALALRAKNPNMDKVILVLPSSGND